MSSLNEGLKKLEKILKESKRIHMDQIKSALNLSDESFNEIVFDLADQLGFIIDGDYVEVSDDSVSVFVNVLDDQFKRWEQNIASGSSKIENIKSNQSESEIVRLHEFVAFRGAQVFRIEADVLKEIEVLTHQEFTKVDKVKPYIDYFAEEHLSGICFSITNNHVTEIGLQHCGYSKTLPESIAQLSSLKELYLCNFSELTLPDSICELKSLQVLYITPPNPMVENNFLKTLKTLPDSIGNLSSLKELHLIGTQLKTLPESIGKLKSLQILNLEHIFGQLTSLPASIGNLSSLQYLNLKYNPLTTLPESIGSLSSLQYLNLECNRLTSLPKSISDLKSLQTLILTDNQLNKLPESIGQLTSLDELRINNQVTILPELIEKLEKKGVRIIYDEYELF